jgi:steroid delta-isomerase-like uncharacterized protein
MEKTNEQIINEFIQTVWREGNLDALEDFWNANYVNHAAPPEMSSGFDALRDYHETFLQGFSDVQIFIHEQISEADKIATRIVTRARNTSNFLGLPATNKTVEMQAIRIDRIENGKIVEHWSTFDLAGLMQQLSGS